MFVALGLMAGSWFLLAMSAVALTLIRWVVIPREQQALLAKFGVPYSKYMETTGRLVPHRHITEGY